MTLREKQAKFTHMVALLILHAEDLGYQLTFGDAYRDPRVHGAMGEKVGYSAAFSCHKLRLAVDFALFRDGKYLTRTEDYTLLGEYWETLGGSWGGRWNDGNHFSLEHDGHK